MGCFRTFLSLKDKGYLMANLSIRERGFDLHKINRCILERTLIRKRRIHEIYVVKTIGI